MNRLNNMQTVLVISAHPDDEVLGCGGAMARLAARGATLHVAFLADGVSSRQGASHASDSVKRRQAAERACAVLGAQAPSFDDFPDNRLDTVALLKLTQRIEELIEKHRPDTIFTHCAGDVNIDHRRIHEAVVTACRPQPGHPVLRLLFFEVASSTEWQTPGSAPAFAPNVFIDISETLELKRAALQAYEAEMRPWPHARSVKAVEHLARWRGANVGMDAAEAFMLGRELI